ncbi:hypothetical protein MPTK1_3g01760 [Marchantia polymorpha subsp. ruderalis]|uniref:Uncharacterized protein n=2 Tax=Marchantia polymorpha TaxID=3197 RepID=A0AAF6AWF1_MARPO|nr:hypothetical protein MARPO_0007s0168 [Marchantia polymorpha]BBN04085.1 hypothetical protein Mp_3g01760 [Marchantia polymorpha subsp. ruderalis]|eukprot:PTQ47772.1 hypothetical protein MARPO_0007s0168 [Marchantia polymorpha]
MAQSASSCASSHSRPSFSASSSDSNPASPRTPSICKEGRLDSAVEECCCATSPPLSPFAAPVEKERSSREHDAALSLIERLDDGWFWDNVVSCRWGQAASSLPAIAEGSGSAAAAAARDRLAGDSASAHGIRPPDAAGHSASQRDVLKAPFRSIEMVQPFVTSRSFSGARDARDHQGLPRSRLRPLTRRTGSMDEKQWKDISFSDSEQKHFTRAPQDYSIPLVGDKRIEPSNLGLGQVRRRRNTMLDVVVPSRRFSDGDETADEVSAPLANVREEGESAPEDKSSNKNQVPPKLVLPGKLGGIITGRDLRNDQTDSNTKWTPPQRRGGKRGRRKSSKSLTEIEYDEMRGCMDLGFSINKDDLTPRVVNVFPGVKDAYKGGDDPFLNSPRDRANSPKGWHRRPESPLLKWQLPTPNGNKVDMKAQLKFWAHAVASTVAAEC